MRLAVVIRGAVKVKQYSVRVFELTIDSQKAFFAFMDKNLVMLKHYLIYLKGEITPAIEEYLNHNGVTFTTHLSVSDNKHQELVLKQGDLKIIDEIVRSGQEIKVESDLLVLNRVNSGAKLYVEGNLIVTGTVDGMIFCNGDFMLVKTSPKAMIVFNGAEIDGSLLENKFNKIIFNGEEIIVSPIEKEPKWA
jgi:septum site-determining protein MinC